MSDFRPARCPVAGCTAPPFVGRSDEPDAPYCPAHAPDGWLTPAQRDEYERIARRLKAPLGFR